MQLVLKTHYAECFGLTDKGLSFLTSHKVELHEKKCFMMLYEVYQQLPYK